MVSYERGLKMAVEVLPHPVHLKFRNDFETKLD